MNRTLITLLPLLAACATKSEVRSLPSDAGTKAAYPAAFEKVRIAATDAAGELGFKVKEQSPSSETDYWFISSQGLSSGSGGRYLRVRIAKAGGDVNVFVAVRSKMESREAGQTDELIEKDIQKRIAGRLAAK